MSHHTRSTGRRTRGCARATAASAASVLVLAALPALLVPRAAEAAPQAQSDYVAPYRSSDAPVTLDCTTGAACSGTASADPATGRASATTSYDRPGPTTGEEHVGAAASFTQAVRVPRGTTAATVTATWHIASTSSSATAVRGLLAAGSQLSAQILCDGGCVTTRAVRDVHATCSVPVTGCLNPPPHDVELTVTATVRDLSRSSFQVLTQASAFALAHPLCGVTTSPSSPLPTTEDCSVVLDPEHAGSASSAIGATLVRLHVDPS